MKYRDCTIKVKIDNLASNPRKWLNLGVLVTDDFINEVNEKVDGFDDLSEKFGDIAVALPVFKSGTVALYSVTDGRMCGYIFATKARAVYWHGEVDVEKIVDELLSEISALNHYLRGDVYAYEIVEFGFTGGDYCTKEECIEAAKSIIDQEKGIANEYKRLFEQVC